MAHVGHTHNASRILLSDGPGPEAKLNRRRLHRGNGQRYNDQYFDSGGLVMLSLTDPYEQTRPEMFFDPENPSQYNFMFDTIKCYMTDSGPINTINGLLVQETALMDAPGIDFQMYNYLDDANLCAGTILPFEDENAYMEDLKIEQGLRVNPKCAKRRCAPHKRSQ
jgi:hypothetical protein